MKLIKTAFLGGIETAIKLMTAFIVMKYIALKSGPEGLALFGQFYNFIGGLIILLAGAFTTGLVRYLAEGKKEKHYLANALGLGLIFSLIISFLLFFWSRELSLLIFKSADYNMLFYLLAFCSAALMFYQVGLAALNGWGEIRKLIFCKSVASMVFFGLSILFIHFYGLKGGLIALIGMQTVPAFLVLWSLSRIKDFRWSWLKPEFTLSLFKEFYPFWQMSCITLISTPLMLMLIRIHIVQVSNWDTAGLWEAAWKICEFYLLLITTALTTYYVPKLSQVLHTEKEIAVVREVLFFAVLVALILATGLFFLKKWIILLLFSEQFLVIAPLLFFQLAGSVIKIACWVFSYYFLITKNKAWFLSFELVFGLSLYLLSRIFFDHYGLIGLSYAFLINCLLNLSACCFYFIYKKRLHLLFVFPKVCNKEKESTLCNPL